MLDGLATLYSKNKSFKRLLWKLYRCKCADFTFIITFFYYRRFCKSTEYRLKIKQQKYRHCGTGTFFQSTDGTGTKKVPRYSTRYCPLMSTMLYNDMTLASFCATDETRRTKKVITGNHFSCSSLCTPSLLFQASWAFHLNSRLMSVIVASSSLMLSLIRGGHNFVNR